MWSRFLSLSCKTAQALAGEFTAESWDIVAEHHVQLHSDVYQSSSVPGSCMCVPSLVAEQYTHSIIRLPPGLLSSVQGRDIAPFCSSYAWSLIEHGTRCGGCRSLR